jgi:hypothetical protein
MFVEADLEVTITDRSVTSKEEYDLKLWLQRAFKANACYRISGFKAGPGKAFKATVALNTRVLAEPDYQRVESGQEPALLRWFIETMFEGKGTVKIQGEPRLKAG